MALTDFQSRTLRLLEANRRKTGGSYVAGGLALNLSLDAPRESHDIDIFHDSAEALVGRTEPRDWIDVITSIQEIQPMLYLISAACGKDYALRPLETEGSKQ